MGLAAWWLIIGAAALWRRTVWQQAGEHVRALAASWSVPVQTSFTGFRVVSGSRSVRWSGGIDGYVTVVRDGKSRERVKGWLTAAEASERLGDEPTV